MNTLINYTNHPSSKWSEEQKVNWNIIDIPFPNIPPEYGEKELRILFIAELSKIEDIISEIYGKDELTEPIDINICIMGEQSYVGFFIKNIKRHSIHRYHFWFPTTERISEDKVNEDGSVTKVSVFKFVRWRKI